MKNKGLTTKQFRRLTVMYTIFVLVYFACGIALAKTETECYKKLAKDTKHSETAITKMIMECNNMFLDGQFIYLGPTKVQEKLIRKRWPAKDEEGNDIPVGELEKADKIIFYAKCEEISRNLKIYINQCLKEK